MARTLEVLRQRPHLSVSAMKMWLSCPRKFRLHYVDRARASHRSMALVFGHAWHDLIGFVLLNHKKGTRPTARELEQYVAATLEREMNEPGPPVLFEDDEDTRSLVTTAMSMLDALISTLNLPENLLHIELPFSLELTDPFTGEVLPMPLIGAVDAVVRVPDGVELWEFKSAKRRWSEDALLFDFQPTAYRMAARARLTSAPEGQSHIHLKLIVTTKTRQPDVQIENLVRTRADERDLCETAASIHRAVEAGCFHPARSWVCKTCEYADVCE